jgi:hypothetical protein
MMWDSIQNLHSILLSGNSQVQPQASSKINPEISDVQLEALKHYISKRVNETEDLYESLVSDIATVHSDGSEFAGH